MFTTLIFFALSRPAESPPNFGIIREHLGYAGERFTLNGQHLNPAQAREAMAALADDSQRLRLTIIGPAPYRKPVIHDLENHPSLKTLRDQLRVQAYEPDHWAVARSGFVVTGKPTIYLQSPDGRVLHRQDEYRGPEKLAEAIRKANPNYRPENDPDLNVKTISSRLAQVPKWGWALISLPVLFLISRRRDS
jgi:hypothetical protein